MNPRNKYLLTTLRILFGLFMLWSGLGGLYSGYTMQGVPPEMIEQTQVLWDTGILQLIKITEAIVGLMLLANFLPWLAVLFQAPIAIGIVVVNARGPPEYLVFGLIMGFIVCAFEAYFGYAYWSKYKQLFERT